MKGHYDGQLTGLAVSKVDNKFVTCGGDKTVRIWDADTYQMVVQTMIGKFENDLRAIDWSYDGSSIVVGDDKGNIYLLKYNKKDNKLSLAIGKTETKFSRK